MDGVVNMVGFCKRHRCNMITEDDVPKCLKCMQEEAEAKAVPHNAPPAADPGHDVMVNWKEVKPDPRETMLSVLEPVPCGLPPVLRAIAILREAPMPKNLKDYKAIQRAIKALESTLQLQEA